MKAVVWEHCRLFVRQAGADDPDVFIHYYTHGRGPHHVGKTGTATDRGDDGVQRGFINLGEQGWELVTVIHAPGSREPLTYYFKRRQ